MTTLGTIFPFSQNDEEEGIGDDYETFFTRNNDESPLFQGRDRR